MTITLDNAPATRQLANNQSSLTFSFTRAAGNGALYVSVSCTTGATISGVTYGGESLTQIGTTQVDAAGSRHHQFRLVNPSSSGANNVVVTATGSVLFILATALSLSGDIDSSTPSVSAGISTGVTSRTASLSIGSGSWAILSAAATASDVAAGTGTTSTNSANPITGYNSAGVAGTVNMAATTSGLDNITTIISEVVPGAASPEFTASPTTVDPHTSGIIVTLTGTATTWTGGTTFSVSGLSGTSKTAQSVASGTSATITLTTGTTAGTLTISDGSVSTTITISDRKTVMTTQSGCDIMVIEPASYDGSVATGVAFYHHGNGETRTAWNDEARKSGIRDALLAAGYLLVGISAGATAWGNDSAMAKYTIAHPYILSTYNVSGIVLVGQSMGGLTAFRASADPSTYQRVRGVYGIYPCCGALAQYDSPNDTYDSQILSAWSAADRTALAAAVAGKDPLVRLAAAYPNIRYRFHASDSDTVVYKDVNTDAMRTLLGGTSTIENSLVATSGDHGDPSNFDGPDIVAFFADAMSDVPSGSGVGMFSGIVGSGIF